MTKYITRPLPVEAFRFNNEALKDLPEWLREYEDYSPLGGKSPVTRTPIGNLLIPAPERSHEVIAGEWVVLYNGKAFKLKDAEFNTRFEAVGEEAPTTAEVVETPPPAPVEPPATEAGNDARPTAPASVSEPAAQTEAGGDAAV